MKLLLDTHVLLWAESTPHKLGPETQRLLLDEQNELRVSAISTLELARLISLSKISLNKSLSDWLAAARRDLSFRDAPLSHAAAIDSYQLPPPFHRDPADRMLVATARESCCTLITADKLILDYPHVRSHNACS